MDKAIRIIVIIFIAFNGRAQEWQSIENTNLGESYYWWGASTGNKAFKINRVNNSIWWAKNAKMYTLNSFGDFTLHSGQTDSNLPPDANVYYQEFAFIGENVFAVDSYTGVVYKCDDGLMWSQASPTTNGQYISTEADSLWVCQIGDNIIKMINGIPTYYPDAQRRIQSRHGHIWSSGILTAGNDLDYIRYYEPLTFEYHSADTAEFVLDNYINDFKFMNNSDTFYLAGNSGFSIAYGNQFFDTLTPNNTTNMPFPSIVEFEFDQNDNVWALLGTDEANISYLAYLDRSSNEWTQVYDSNNSPLDYSEKMSLELDSAGNVYVMQSTALHILKINNAPGWLDVHEQKSASFEVFPNPSTGKFSIMYTDGIDISEIQIIDVKGELLETLPFQQEISLNYSSGIYLLRFKSGEDFIGMKRIVID